MVSLSPNPIFSQPASDERIAKTVQALEANGMHAVVVETGDEARQYVLDLLPEEAEIFTTGSRTLETIGLAAEINASGRFRAIRPQLMSMDRQTQGREMTRLAASPEIVVGSVHAITERGQVLIVSATGSQLSSYVSGAGKVIWVVGTQKLVSDLDEGFRRINEYSYALENARMHALNGQNSFIGKTLLVHREKPNRITIVLVKENLGF